MINNLLLSDFSRDTQYSQIFHMTNINSNDKRLGYDTLLRFCSIRNSYLTEGNMSHAFDHEDHLHISAV